MIQLAALIMVCVSLARPVVVAFETDRMNGNCCRIDVNDLSHAPKDLRIYLGLARVVLGA